MSQPSIEVQVRDLEASGFPVKKHAFGPTQEARPQSPEHVSDIWISRWANNVFRNFPIVSQCHGAKFLQDACHGMPAFVVGVGPSLDKSIADLKETQGKSVIISTDAAVRALLANGITPDLVVSFDCKPDQNLLWQGVHVPIPGLFNSCTHPDSIASWPGPILFFNQYHTVDELCAKILPDVLPNLGQLPSSGTVGNMAMMAAHLMGCTPIMAVGMDFCYQPAPGPVVSWRYRGQDYKWVPGPERGAGLFDGWEPTEIKSLYDNDERVSRSFVVNANGKEYRTDPELGFYLQSFKELMPHFHIPVVNCTPDGMIPCEIYNKNADGTTKETIEIPAMTVKEAVEKYCPKPFQAGRSVLKYLAEIAPDPRHHLTEVP